MWLGEQITERGIGNGISLIIFAGIVARLPAAVVETYRLFEVGQLTGFWLVMLIGGVGGGVGAGGVFGTGQGQSPGGDAQGGGGRRGVWGAGRHKPRQSKQGRGGSPSLC